MINENSDFILPEVFVEEYFTKLKGKFYKILPMKENEEPSLKPYMLGLERELTGCHKFIKSSEQYGEYTSLLCVLRYLIESDCNVEVTKKEVFKAIDICNKLGKKREGIEYGCVE